MHHLLKPCELRVLFFAVGLLALGSLLEVELTASAEPLVSRVGLAVRRQAGKQRDLGSNLPRLSLLFKSCGLWTLSCDSVPHN